ncbi:acyloxyacyl hydrolase [Rubrolithibacter danxiaensis]|uniref:acyloxyacyl hydrolase n=1 Tax=Rubrolithibacter danxiaensis TaxID=3390805 RepID=UPI003BF8441B
MNNARGIEISFILLFLLSFYTVKAQNAAEISSDSLFNNSNTRHISFGFESGGVMATTGKAENLLREMKYSAIDLRLGWQGKQDNIYAYLHHYPVFGFGLTKADFNTSAVGQPLAFYGFASLPVGGRHKRYEIDFTLALGSAVNFNPFNKDNNPSNLLIGSRITQYFGMGFNIDYLLSPKFSIGVGTNLKHFSNGSYQKPNLGINLTPISVTAKYSVNKRILPPRMEVPVFKPVHSFDIYTSVGGKQFDIAGDRYFKGAIGLFYMYQTRYSTRWGIGTELFYSGSGPSLVSGDASRFSKSTSIAIVPAFDWLLTKNLFVALGTGIYLKRNIENDERTFFYESLNLRYRFLDQFTVGVGLKAHEGAADFFGYTLGYSLIKKRE